MELVDTLIFQFIWKATALGIFFVLMKGLALSAVASWKRSNGSWWSVVDEAVKSLVYIVIFGMIVILPPSVIINTITSIVSFVWNLIAPILRDYLGLPI